MKKTIVVFSNPFGYGPTGNAIPIIRSLLKKINYVDIIFAGSGLCMEIISEVPIKKVYLDERNENQIKDYLCSLDNPFVIGSQNRFCIRAAKKLNIPCSFVDVLAWFWNKIPEDHLLADEIFWIRFPNIKDKMTEGYNNIHLVSSIISTLPPAISKKKRLMIHIGGAKYPLSNEIPYSYLNLIAKGSNALKISENFDHIIFAGGSEAVNYLKQKIVNKKLLLVSLAKEKFIQKLSQSAHMMTIAGVSSTLESFSLNVPTSFLLPLNLSQIALLNVLLKNKCAPNYLQWDNYVEVNKNLMDMTEKDAIVEINKYATIVNNDDKLSKKFIDDFANMAELIPNNSKQVKLIEYIGDSGADEIVDILIKKWGLPKSNIRS